MLVGGGECDVCLWMEKVLIAGERYNFDIVVCVPFSIRMENNIV